MKALLPYFLVQNKKLSIPNVGSISIVTQNAVANFSAKTITSPSYNLTFKRENDKKAESAFVQFAIQKLEVTGNVVKDFMNELANEFKINNRLDIDAVGVIAKESGHYNFQPHSFLPYYPTIEVDRVVHSGEVHAVKVGEDEKSSTEMRALLSEEKSKSYWWAYVLVISLFLAGCGLMYYYYFFQK